MDKSALLKKLPSLSLPAEEQPKAGSSNQRSAAVKRVTWHNTTANLGFTPHSTYDIYDHSTEMHEVKAYLLDSLGKTLKEIYGTSSRQFHESVSGMLPDGRTKGESVSRVLKEVPRARYLLVITDQRKKWHGRNIETDHSEYEVDIYPLK